jgi:hypothetical protein
MKRNNLIITLLVLIIFSLGAYVYYLKTNTSIVNYPEIATTSTQPVEQLVGNDQDEHGCKASAGYSWCETKSKCLRVWEEACPVDPKVLESQVMTDLVAKRGESVKQLTFSVSKIEGNYAQGGISGQGGGAMWFASNVDGIWKLVWDGNGVILCSDLINYPDFPTTMIPECYDTSTQKNITR